MTKFRTTTFFPQVESDFRKANGLCQMKSDKYRFRGRIFSEMNVHVDLLIILYGPPLTTDKDARRQTRRQDPALLPLNKDRNSPYRKTEVEQWKLLSIKTPSKTRSGIKKEQPSFLFEESGLKTV